MADNTFITCCTGAHLAPNIGKEKVDPSTAIAINKAVVINFLFESIS